MSIRITKKLDSKHLFYGLLKKNIIIDSRPYSGITLRLGLHPMYTKFEDLIWAITQI